MQACRRAGACVQVKSVYVHVNIYISDSKQAAQGHVRRRRRVHGGQVSLGLRLLLRAGGFVGTTTQPRRRQAVRESHT